MPKFKYSVEGEIDMDDEDLKESSNHVKTVTRILRDCADFGTAFTTNTITVEEIEPGAGADR